MEDFLKRQEANHRKDTEIYCLVGETSALIEIPSEESEEEDGDSPPGPSSDVSSAEDDVSQIIIKWPSSNSTID